MPVWLPHIDSSVVLDGLTSLLLLLSLLIVRTLIVRAISKNPTLSMEAKRRWVVSVRNTMVSCCWWGWSSSGRTNSKPLPCPSWRSRRRSCWRPRSSFSVGAGRRYGWAGEVYSVGDRIQIAGHRGVVLDHDIFTTKLLEIGPGQASHLYTGRVTVFPNSLLLTNALVKENPGQEYGLYLLVIPLRDKEDWRDAERHLLDAASAECSSFMEEAGRHMKLLEQTSLLEAPSPEPRITIQLSEPGRVQLVLRFPAPDRGRSRIEQAILRRYLTAAAATN